MHFELPTAFVWSKMQAEAGQSLSDIVRRKEIERKAGGGQFFWGIGSSLGESLSRLVRQTSPRVLFSIMRTPPKRVDVSPEGIMLWTRYIDSSGRSTELPPHALITSRATTGTGDKRRHYALVCYSDVPLRLQRLGTLNASHLWNLGSAITRVGSSQVTAVVEHGALYADESPETGPLYEVNMTARLSLPYFVRLTHPLIVPPHARAQLAEALSFEASAEQWLAFSRHLRSLAEHSSQEPDLFSGVWAD